MRLNPFTLTADQLESARALAQAVQPKAAVGVRRRIGTSRGAALSVYRTTRWFDWRRSHRHAFKALFPQNVIELAVVGHFLELPVNTGFLDRMAPRPGTTRAGYMVSFNVGTAPAKLKLNGKKVVVQVGGSVAFSLAGEYEIPKSNTGQLWACVMLVGPPAEWVQEGSI